MKANEVVYVAALGKSPRKTIQGELGDRLAMLKEMTAEFGDRVVVLSVPDIEAAGETVRKLQNEHGVAMTAAFGANVFTANHARLKAIKGLENLEFAYIPFGDDVPSLPEKTKVLRVANGADTSLPPEVAKYIADRAIYPEQNVGPRNPNPLPRTPCGTGLAKIQAGGTFPIEIAF